MIDDTDLAALAKGMVPVVRQVVTEAMTSLTARITELEARPIGKGDIGERGPQGESGPPGPPGPLGPQADGNMTLLPELAAQVASAVRLLHESPPLKQYNEPPPSPRVARIERDEQGNFIPVYDQPV